MAADSMWELFRKTGNIVFYCLYRALTDAEAEDRTA